jgi:hypothetical protein
MGLGAVGLRPGDIDGDIPQAGNAALLGIQRPGPIRRFVEGDIGLRRHWRHTGHHLGHLGLGQLGSPRLLLHPQRTVAAQGYQPANGQKRKQEDRHGDHHFEERHAVSART